MDLPSTRPVRRVRLAAAAALALGAAVISFAGSAGATAGGAGRHSHGGERTYEVTITNLTAGQPLTPPVVATHRGRDQIFDVGEPASVGVREIAENGNNAPLLRFLEADPFGTIAGVTQAGDAPLVPAGTPGGVQDPPQGPEFPESVTFEITADRRSDRLSFVAMLVCTNDGFTGVNALRLPSRVGRSVTEHTVAYDAFTELNTEDFADIVPPCQALIGVSSGEPGTGVSDPAIAEGGVISPHAGIVGGSDLVPAVHGWTDPVAEITITRTG
ncbi:MAG: spondin domain-containing protein [Acidimicrobiales bacterium]